LTAKKSFFKLPAPVKSYSPHSAHEKILPALRDTLIIRAVARGRGVHLHKLGPPPLGPAPPRGMLSFEAPPIDEFQPNQSSPQQQKSTQYIGFNYLYHKE